MTREEPEVPVECIPSGDQLVLSVTVPLAVLDAADKKTLFAQANPYTQAVWQALVAAWKARQTG